MTREEALKQIEEINRAVEASNKFIPSGRLSLFWGLTILVVPVIEVFSARLTFGHDFGDSNTWALPLIHVAVYLTLFSGVRWVVEKVWPEDLGQSPNPVLNPALAFHRPILTSVCGSIIMLGYLSMGNLIYPFFMIFFGILLNLYGRFSNKQMFWIGWSYIFLGIIGGCIAPSASTSLWIYLNTYVGLSVAYVGLVLIKERK